MAVYDLVSNSSTFSLPEPMQNGYNVQDNARGTAHKMASGAYVWEGTSTSLFRTFVIEWSQLTAAQVTVIENACIALITTGTGTWACPSGTTYTVILAGDGLPRWRVRKIKKGTELRYSGSLTLEQNA